MSSVFHAWYKGERNLRFSGLWAAGRAVADTTHASYELCRRVVLAILTSDGVVNAITSCERIVAFDEQFITQGAFSRQQYPLSLWRIILS